MKILSKNIFACVNENCDRCGLLSIYFVDIKSFAIPERKNENKTKRLALFPGNYPDPGWSGRRRAGPGA